MLTTLQMELDFETDRARQQRQEWQRALDHNLHAIGDYVYPHQLIVWYPGVPGERGRKAVDVQLTTTTSCTCQRFRLRDRCEHIEFAKHLEAAGITPETDVPVSARSIEESEDQAA